MSSSQQDHRWNGAIADSSEAFAQLKPSDSYRAVQSGTAHDFAVATRADYESALRAAGLLADEEAVENHPDLVATIQAHWHATGNDGCRFAMYLSENRERFGWETWVMAARSDLAATAETIATIAGERLTPVEVDVLSLILPDVTTPATLAWIVRRLGQFDGWRLDEKQDPSDDETALLCLSVAVDLGHWSEILGFGSGAPLANTRRAPFTELAIRAKPPPRRARRDQRAYMADVPLDTDKETFRRWWKETERCRARRLGDDQDARGKARVTTVVGRSKGA